MSAKDFLLAVARYLAAYRLYDAGHSARDEALEETHARLEELLDRRPHPSFSFFKQKVICDDAALRELDDWEWTPRLMEAGVERLEISAGVDRPELQRFLDHLGRHLVEGAEGDIQEAPELPHISFGALGFRGQDRAGTGEGTAAGTIDLGEEAETLSWLHETAAAEGRVPAAETVMMVRSLSLAVHEAEKLVVPFLRLKETDQYTAAHGINVAVLSMRLAEALDLPSRTVLDVGTAGLLHDLGKVDVPAEILDKPDKLTDEEMEVMRRHPVDGCRNLLESGPELSLAAVVAYEHHMTVDGGGYPERHYRRDMLPETRLVQVCDFYDAVRARRVYSSPMSPAEATELLGEVAGDELDADYVGAFLDLIRTWDPSEALVEEREAGVAEAAG